MSFISIDYNKAYAEANRLKTAANECENTISQNLRALNDIHVYWEGAAANEFMSANEKWRREMQSIKTELAAISSLIIKITNEIREADMRAAEAVKNS